MFEKNTVYKDFVVLGTFDVPDFHSKAVHLAHRRTGLEILSLSNDDRENFFSFAFRTPNEKANGAAHILEHSVLCGSERYPLKDPFVVLSNQSVKTYLNAATYPDRTLFPASSTVRADFFNLLDVYGDAVFFPNLAPEIFMQEAHRLEIGEDGRPEIQGVVYNEMKGEYSSFDNAAGMACDMGLLDGTVYMLDSGGDPLSIPSITREELLEFHRKWYRPDNCMLSFYGDIPLEEKIDFIEEKFLGRLGKKFPEIDYSGLSVEELRKKKDENVSEFLKFVTPKKLERPVEIFAEGPDGDGETGNTVVVNWLIGGVCDNESASELSFLSGILMQHDGSPLQKALLDSRLGEDVSPLSGFSSYILPSVFSAGLRGVKPGDEKKVESLIFSTLERLAAEGIDRSDIESTIRAMEFSRRTVRRHDGPFSRAIMNWCVFGWLYGYDISRQIRDRSVLGKIRKKLEENPRYFEDKIRKFLVENNSRSLVVVSPTKEYGERRAAAERKIADELFSRTTKERVLEDKMRLNEFQRRADDSSIIPHLRPGDFLVGGKVERTSIKTEIEYARGADFADSSLTVPIFKNPQPTNGIVYFQVAFPLDFVPEEDYALVPLVSSSCIDCGWTRRSDGKFLDWAQSTAEMAMHAGNFFCTVESLDYYGTERGRELFSRNRWVGRDWLMFRAAMLEEEMESVLTLVADCVSTVDFGDLERISDLAVKRKNAVSSAVISHGHLFAYRRAKALFSKGCLVDEIWNGVSGFYFTKKIAENFGDGKKAEKIAESYRRVFALAKDGGAFVQVVAEDSFMERAVDLSRKFVLDAGIRGLSERRARNLEIFEKMTRLPESFGGEVSGGGEREEVLVANCEVGFSSECFSSTGMGDWGHPAELVASHWLSNNLLWERIRTIGGAYGAFCSADSDVGIFDFETYRDPRPLDSCGTFEKCLEEAGKAEFSVEETEKTVIGFYSDFIQPHTPQENSAIAIRRELSGFSDEDRWRRNEEILKISPDDLKNAFGRLSNGASGGKARKMRVSICPRDLLDSAALEKSDDRKIIYLPI